MDSLLIVRRLKLAREMTGITQKQVGAMLGVHRVTVCHFETGRRKPSATQRLPLAQMFGVSVGWLVGEEDPKSNLELAGLSDKDFNRLVLLE